MECSPSRRLSADVALAAAILLLGLFLVSTGRWLLGHWQKSSARGQSLAFEDLLGMAANTAGLVIVAWWLLSLLAAFGSAALARTGNQRAAEITGRLSPAFMRRLALAAVGLQLLGAPLAHAAADPAKPDWSPTSSPVAALWSPTGVAVPSADGNEAVQAATPSATASLSQTSPSSTVRAPAAAHTPPSSRWGTADAKSGVPISAPPGEGVHPMWKPSGPVVEPGPLSAQPLRSARQQSDAEPGHVTVKAGETLWSIAARELGGSTASDVDVALEWPRWYEANRAVIGDNPDLLLPGQVLRPPVRL